VGQSVLNSHEAKSETLLSAEETQNKIDDHGEYDTQHDARHHHARQYVSESESESSFRASLPINEKDKRDP